MPNPTVPGVAALPEPVLRFAEQGAGLLVFSGDSAGASAAARALVDHIEAATGRQAEHRDPNRLHVASDRPGLIVDDRGPMDVDRLLRLVAEAEAGALVVATMGYAGGYPDGHLVDIVRPRTSTTRSRSTGSSTRQPWCSRAAPSSRPTCAWAAPSAGRRGAGPGAPHTWRPEQPTDRRLGFPGVT